MTSLDRIAACETANDVTHVLADLRARGTVVNSVLTSTATLRRIELIAEGKL